MASPRSSLALTETDLFDLTAFWFGNKENARVPSYKHSREKNGRRVHFCIGNDKELPKNSRGSMLVFPCLSLVLSGIAGNFGCRYFLPCTTQHSGWLSFLLKKTASASDQAALQCISNSEVVDSKSEAGKKSRTVQQGDHSVHWLVFTLNSVFQDCKSFVFPLQQIKPLYQIMVFYIKKLTLHKCDYRLVL